MHHAHPAERARKESDPVADACWPCTERCGGAPCWCMCDPPREHLSGGCTAAWASGGTSNFYTERRRTRSWPPIGFCTMFTEEIGP